MLYLKLIYMYRKAKQQRITPLYLLSEGNTPHV
nr:MAG TPA: hypothetical protein [Bacteriophage sp.]